MVLDEHALVLAGAMWCFAVVVASCLGWTSEEVGVAFAGSMVVWYTVANFALNSEPSKVPLMMCDLLSSSSSTLFSSCLLQSASCEVMFCIRMANVHCGGHVKNTQIEVVSVCLNFHLCPLLQLNVMTRLPEAGPAYTWQLSRTPRISPQTNTCPSCALCPHSCAPGKDFPVGHPSTQAKHA
jgi:hypothetical protein